MIAQVQAAPAPETRVGARAQPARAVSPPAVITLARSEARPLAPVPLPPVPLLARPGARYDAPPLWLQRDVQRRAPWLPETMRRHGIAAAHAEVLRQLPPDVQSMLHARRIPPWMIGLAPIASPQRNEIIKQLRFMATLAGPAPAGPIAARAEELLLFCGAAQLPTPGDVASGVSLRDEGCTAVMCRYILGQLRTEFPERLASLPAELASCQHHGQMLALMRRPGVSAIVDIESRRFEAARPQDFHAGSIVVAVKPGGTHVMGFTRVPAGWGWSPTARMAIGNTGLREFGTRMILAQEYVTEEPHRPGELTHNAHGPITSTNVVRVNGRPVLNDPRTNPYGVRGASFTFVRFRG